MGMGYHAHDHQCKLLKSFAKVVPWVPVGNGHDVMT